MKFTREDLIKICETAVVPFRNWNNRDSYSAQVNVDSVYKGLKAGVKFTIEATQNVIWIYFKKPTKKQKDILYDFCLPIDSIEDYFAEFGYDSEMFTGYGIDWNESYLIGYLPTTKRLEEADGEDWY